MMIKHQLCLKSRSFEVSDYASVFGLANILDLLKMTFKYFNVKSTCFFFWGMCVVFLGGCLQQIQVRSGRMFSSSNSDDWHPSTSAVELRTFRLSHTTVRFVFGVTGPRSRHLSIMQHFTSDTELNRETAASHVDLFHRACRNHLSLLLMD